MDAPARDRFDALLEEAIAALPDHLAALLDEIPIVVEDRPDRALIDSLAKEWGEEPDPDLAEHLCGLHTGVPITERSVESAGDLPTDVRLFREGILNTAGGWDQPRADDAVYEEIMVTLLHELGHHFGLEEDDLADLGYD